MRRYANWKNNGGLSSSLDASATEDGIYVFDNDQCIATRAGDAEIFYSSNFYYSQEPSTIVTIDNELKSNQLVFKSEASQATSDSKKVESHDAVVSFVAFLGVL